LNYRNLLEHSSSTTVVLLLLSLFRIEAKVGSLLLEFFYCVPNWRNIPLNMEKKGWKQRWKAMGIAGFLFFLIKGIIWLFVLGAGAFKACS
jgi:hypothetical protein